MYWKDNPWFKSPTKHTRWLLRHQQRMTGPTLSFGRSSYLRGSSHLRKQTFLNTVRELYLLVTEQLLVKWLGPQSQRHVVSLRQANPNDPKKWPSTASWSRWTKYMDFPILTNQDPSNSYDLVNIDLKSKILNSFLCYHTQTHRPGSTPW